MSIPPRIGFIGLGIMGRAMADNLLKAGFNLSVYNRDRLKTTFFADQGCTVAPTPKTLAAGCNVIFTMVADPAAMDAVVEGPEGVFAAGFDGNILINMSTVSVDYTRKLRDRCFLKRVKFVDCPVSGSKPLAESGKLIMLAGGEEKTVEEVKPLLLAMGKAVVYSGPAPSGTALKLCMNLIVAGLTSALAESALLAERLEIDPKLIFSVLGESPALNCAYFKMKERNILEKDFPPAFALKHMLKDARFMISEAAARGQRLPVTEAIEELMTKAGRAGEGEKDLTVILKTLAEDYRMS
ncbi:MAG: NAD(P)-dependent oxidoreductase [Elusimicrobiales bacterium]|jgi:3-hydroxyisobutyrate dehydrogenase-like beta-hydroxyacid dehydrogenase